MKKIFVIEHFFLTPHFETSIELAVINNINNNKVYYVYLKQFYSILLLPYHLKLSSLKNIIYLKGRDKKNRFELKKLTKKYKIKVLYKKNLSFFTFLGALKYALFHPYGIDKFEKYRYKNLNLGIGCLSTFISSIENDQPKITFTSFRLKKILFESVIAFELSNKILKINKPDLVYIFNGRFHIDNAIVKACQLNKIPIKLHERGSNFKKYEIYEWPLHSYYNINKKILSYYNNKNIDQKQYEEVARNFFEFNREGKELSWISYNSHFKKVSINHTSKKRFIYFTSSDDEVASLEFLEKDKQPIFKNQRDCIKFLTNYFFTQKDKELIIRVHPHMKKKSKELKSFWDNMKGENITVINSYSTTDSYQLIEESDIILTFGSTIGIEATFWGKPSILLGSAYYMFLDCTYNPQNQEELIKLLNLDNLVPLPKESTYKYGYYMMTYGKEFKYYKPKNFFEGELIL
jgi:hypothetical protein